MSRPPWRQFFDSWEQAVAPGLQDFTASSGFRDVMAASAKINADMAREFERMSRQWLHLWNLPAATDVRALRRQVASLERELSELRRELPASEKRRSLLGVIPDVDDDTPLDEAV